MKAASAREGLFTGEVMEHLSERFAERKNCSEVASGEVRARAVRRSAFAADLDDADDFAVQQNWRADHLLDGFDGLGAEFYAFEDGSVACGGEIVLDFGAAVAGGARGQGRIAGQRDEADIFQGFGDQKMQVAPAVGDREDSDFVILYAEIPGNLFSNGGKGNLRSFAIRAEGVGDALHFRDQIQGCAHASIGLLAPRPGEVWPGELHPSRYHFRVLRTPRQENFEPFVLAERTVQLASPDSCAYTDFAAVLNAPFELFRAIRLGLTRRRGHVFDGNSA